MAHFNFEKDLNTLLRCDNTISKGPLARWERKAMETSTPAASLSMTMSNLTINNSNMSVGKTSSSKTPVKTPKLSGEDKGKYLTPGKTKLTPGRKTPKTPTDPNCVGDRFIPNRSAMQLDIGHYMITKASSDNEENISPNSMRYREVMSENLNGDLSNFRVMAYQKKAPLAPTGHANALKVLYSSCKNPTSKKTTRFIPQTPERILDAPEIIDDYYLNLIDWSPNNLLAVGLSGGLYIWNATSGTIQHIMEIPEAGEYISSVSWLKEGNCLAVGTSMSTIELWDVEMEKRIRVMKSHPARVSSLSWNSYVLSSGSKSGSIHHHDVRIAEHHVGSLAGHTQEVCGLQWSPDGRYLASGGNDNVLNIWACNMSLARAECQPVYTFNEHQAAVKAIAWCPWQSNVLATGGGTADRHIRFWNCNLGTSLNSINAKSQVCAILWSKEYKELISGHGFANYELNIWKYPQMSKVTELTGHTARILNLAMSPDGTTVMSAGADETLRLWNCFAVDPKKKKATSISFDKKSDMMKSIR